MRLLKNTLKWLLIGVVGILGLGFIVEQIIQWRYNAKKPAASEFCTINGRKTHFVKSGSGGPTVVFQSGLGGDHHIWKEIQLALSKSTTTISYDRAGLLWSDPLDGHKTLDNITDELHQLLEKTNCPKPYILVGHSLAGVTLRPFVSKYAADVQAVVLVDVSHPLQIKRSSEALKKYLVVPPAWLVGTLTETGVLRTYYHFNPFVSDLPRTHWMNRHIRNYFYRFYQTTLQEATDDDVMFEQAAQINSFGDIPLTVITGGYPLGAPFLKDTALAREYLSIHRDLQQDLLRLSTQSKQIIAEESGHYVPLQQPALVVDAVKDYLR